MVTEVASRLGARFTVSKAYGNEPRFPPIDSGIPAVRPRLIPS